MTIQQKIPLSRSLPQLSTRAAQDEQEQIGQRLPGHVVAVSGSIVTVNFDVEGATLPQVTMAAVMSKYVRVPIQVGDIGYATTADAYLGGVTGLGGGAADLTQWGNLSNLVWVPVSNKNWAPIAGAGGAVGIDASVVTTDNLSVGNGASGTFTTGTGQTVDVIDGIIVNIY